MEYILSICACTHTYSKKMIEYIQFNFYLEHFLLFFNFLFHKIHCLYCIQITMDDLNEKLLNEFNIKPCKIKLDNVCLKKIGISCTITDEKNKTLKCALKQTDLNSFSVKIISNSFELMNEDAENRSSKKAKFSVMTNKSNRPDKSANLQNVGLKRIRSANNTPESVIDIVQGQKHF